MNNDNILFLMLIINIILLVMNSLNFFLNMYLTF